MKDWLFDNYRTTKRPDITHFFFDRLVSFESVDNRTVIDSFI